MPTSPIERRELTSAEPILFRRESVPRAELSDAIGRCFEAVFGYCAQAGVTTPGIPFTRYQSIDDAATVIEAGCKLASSVPGAGEIEAGFLASGPVAYAIHAGHYDALGETYSALEQWMQDQGVHPAGAPWEVYLTDPGEHPDPADWRTEVYWPVAE